MSTPNWTGRLELPCGDCLRDTAHVVLRAGATCRTCGTLAPTQVTNQSQQRVVPTQRRKVGSSRPSKDRSSKSSTASALCATASALTGTDGSLDGDALAKFDADPVLAQFVVEKAGLAFVVGQEQRWTLPESEAAIPITLWIDNYGHYVIDIIEGWVKNRTTLSLMEIYAFTIIGARRTLKAPELARYKRRAMLHVGILTGPPPLPALPENATADAHATWEVVQELRRIRRVLDASGWPIEPPGEPMPLTCAFLADFSDPKVDAKTIRRGLSWLGKHSFILRAGSNPSQGPRKDTVLWTIMGDGPAPKPPAPARPNGATSMTASQVIELMARTDSVDVSDWPASIKAANISTYRYDRLGERP